MRNQKTGGGFKDMIVYPENSQYIVCLCLFFCEKFVLYYKWPVPNSRTFAVELPMTLAGG